MAHASSLETKKQILDVAECAIAQHGYAGTTLRNVVSKANVNLAAVHYHFGSKEDLLKAVISRIAEPIVSGQLTALEGLGSEQALSPESILRAYLGASFTSCNLSGDVPQPVRAQFISRCRTEPEPVQQIAAEQFGPGTEKFLDALQRALPEQSRSQLRWKLDLVVACLLRVLAQTGSAGALLKDNTPEAFEVAVPRLISFLLPGLIDG